MKLFIGQTLVLSVLTLIYANSALATTAILTPDEDLIIGARSIVVGRVISISSSFNHQHTDIHTYIRLTVDEVLKGDITASEIVLKQPGGRDGDIASIVFGAPEFSRGERVLVYLDTWPDGSLRVYQMYLGKFTVSSDPRTGQMIVDRGPAAVGVDIMPAATSGPFTDRMELSRYRRMIRETLSANEDRARRFEAQHYRDVPLRAVPPGYKPGAPGRALQPEFTLHPFRGRWLQPDRGQPVTFMLNPDQQPTPQTADDIVAAMNAWSAVNGSLLRITLAGTTEFCLSVDTATIYFDNCDSRFSPSPGCTGFLALGGFFADYSVKQTIGDFDLFQIKGAYIAFNPYMACSFNDDCKVREVATHEMGHALGLGHSWQPTAGFDPTPTALQQDATMYFAAHFDGRCASLRADDIDGITFLYPAYSGDLRIATDSNLAPGLVGAPYTQALAATGGTAPYSWTNVPLKGQLPPGLALSPAGVISGIPVAPGIFAFSAQIVDSSSHAAQKAFSITISPAPLTLATARLGPAIEGTQFSQQLLAGGGIAPYRWAITAGQLPAGLALDASAGVVSGTPSVTGRFDVTVSVSDAASGVSIKQLPILVVSPNSVPQIDGARYKAPAAKLTVTGANFDSGAVLVVDGSPVKTAVQSDAAIVSKGLSLTSGTHQLVIVNSTGVASSAFLLTLN